MVATTVYRMVRVCVCVMYTGVRWWSQTDGSARSCWSLQIDLNAYQVEWSVISELVVPGGPQSYGCYSGDHFQRCLFPRWDMLTESCLLPNINCLISLFQSVFVELRKIVNHLCTVVHNQQMLCILICPSYCCILRIQTSLITTLDTCCDVYVELCSSSIWEVLTDTPIAVQ